MHCFVPFFFLNHRCSLMGLYLTLNLGFEFSREFEFPAIVGL